ncbi:hypothetical protein GCM10010360_39360 [Streptomyces nogalater]
MVEVLPVCLGVPVMLLVLAVISALIVVFTGGLARQAGAVLGLGDAALTACRRTDAVSPEAAAPPGRRARP